MMKSKGVIVNGSDSTVAVVNAIHDRAGVARLVTNTNRAAVQPYRDEERLHLRIPNVKRRRAEGSELASLEAHVIDGREPTEATDGSPHSDPVAGFLATVDAHDLIVQKIEQAIRSKYSAEAVGELVNLVMFGSLAGGTFSGGAPAFASVSTTVTRDLVADFEVKPLLVATRSTVVGQPGELAAQRMNESAAIAAIDALDLSHAGVEMGGPEPVLGGFELGVIVDAGEAGWSEDDQHGYTIELLLELLVNINELRAKHRGDPRPTNVGGLRRRWLPIGYAVGTFDRSMMADFITREVMPEIASAAAFMEGGS